ncbi:hypothetical protein [Flavobacterium sp.]
MKKPALLISLFLLFGFTRSNNVDPILKAVRIQSLGGDKCAVDLELQNNTTQKLQFLSSNCPDRGFYVTDNANVTVLSKACSRDFKVIGKLAGNDSRSERVEFEVRKEIPYAKFRVGFRYVEIPKNVPLPKFDSTRFRRITLWSNAVEFNIR